MARKPATSAGARKRTPAVKKIAPGFGRVWLAAGAGRGIADHSPQTPDHGSGRPDGALSGLNPASNADPLRRTDT